MPAVETMDRNDAALLWVRVGRTRRGEPKVAPLVALDPRDGTGVRWVEKNSTLQRPDGTTVTATVRVIVDRPIPLYSVMWKGRVDDLPGSADFPEGDLFQVVRYAETRDLKGVPENTRRSVDLAPFHDAFPEIVADDF